MNPLRLWGKTGTDGTFHPVLFHMIDVGNVARALLEGNASPRFRVVLARALSVDDPLSLVGWLPLLIALHDIGKVSAAFQGQQGSPRTARERERLLDEGFRFGRTRGKSYHHAHISAVSVQSILVEPDGGLPKPLLLALRDILGGHHGRFASSGELLSVRDYLDYEEPSEWPALRADMCRLLREQLTPEWDSGGVVPSPQHAMAAAMALTGFTILCDWLGSDSERFPIEPPLSLSSYTPLSLNRARQAIERVGFAPARPRASYSGFTDLFPDKGSARPMQQSIDDLPESVLTWPALFVVEAPTGEGKTEAALALAQRLSLTGPSDELYFGLPTTATSNQMFDRVQSFVERTRGAVISVRLVHGQAHLIEDDVSLRLHEDANAGDAASKRAASIWFAPRKRALLAPFGVGTVDQVELATLNARHYMLRLFGLAGKVVIIDEVHAYDTYMSTVLEQALRWLGTLGSCVILLSATLPTARHTALARSFISGVSPEKREDDEGQSLPYPCIAAYTGEKSLIVSPGATQAERRLRIEFVADDTPHEQGRRLVDLVREGGAVCCLCNTVAQAQKVFKAVDELADLDVWRVLIHSRFPADERRKLEKQIATRFGPGSRNPKERAVIVGTQVLEQSLDLDFDAMITDLAPTDLLLQRAGRLHRHTPRPRPPAHNDAVLRVQIQRTGSGAPEFGAWKWVYDEFVLWRTWLVLDARIDVGGGVELILPRDYRPLIEATYDVQETAPDEHPHRELILAAHARHLRDEAQDAAEARLRLVPDPSPTAGITEGRSLRFEEDTDGGQQGWGVAKTRLGPDSITAIPLYRHGDILSLHPGGEEVVGSQCDRACQLRLLQRSVPVSHHLLVPLLRVAMTEAPAWFRNSALLRHTAPLFLDGDSARFDDIVVRLDPRLGLVIEREQRE